MKKSRVEAFSDGVIAILITIMVLELPHPHGADLAALRPVAPIFGSYVVSFLYIGIYWNNHHHMFQLVQSVKGSILWANLHLLFWLSLIPFGTAWMGENNFAPLPVALYGVNLFLCGTAYFLLATLLMNVQGRDSPLRRALGGEGKEKISMLFYLAAIPLAFVNRWISCAIYVGVALIWLVPDTRIERASETTNAASTE